MSAAFESLLASFAQKHGLPAEALLISSEIEVRGSTVSLIYEGDEQSGEILFVGEIGKPAPDQEKEMYAALLQGNNLWAGTDGATLALDPQGVAIACARLPLEGMDAERLADILGTFADTLSYWRGYITQEQAVPA